MRAAPDRDLRQALVTPDTMIEVDDEVADAERREFGEEGVGALAALLTPNEALAEDILLGEQADRVARKAMVERQDDHRGRAAAFGRSCAERILPAVHGGERGDAVVPQQARQSLARAARIAGDDRLAALATLVRQMVGDLCVDIFVGGALGREIARGEGFEIDDRCRRGHVEGGHDMDRTLAGRPDPFGLGQIEPFGRERAIASRRLALGGDAVGMIVGDRGKARLGGRFGAMAAQHRRRGIDMVEQRRQPFLEQGQPMVHARLTPAVADGLIERVASRLCAEQVAIAGAETLDRRFVEQGFAGGEQLQRLCGAEAALVGGVEAADALDLVAEEIDAQAIFLARREQVENAAAHRELALIGDGVDAAEAVRYE